MVATVHGYTDVSVWNRVALYNRVDRFALRRADRVVLVHKGMTATAGLNRPHDPRWTVIENGIKTRDMPVTEPLDPNIVRYCENRSLVIGAVGRLSHEKGFDVMLQGVAEILREDDRARVVILGEGPERPALERLAENLGVADRVLLPGYRPQARNYLRLFDLFVLPSRTEGLPITLLEAMHAGVPVVATKVGGVPYVLDEGLGGGLVEPGDPRALTAAIRRSVEDRAFASTLAAHAAAQVQARFTSEAMARKYLDLYREVVTPAGL
jgi:glycosyltransferase involved in cell wall biosynthesis